MFRPARLAACALLICGPAVGADAPPDFARDVLPILRDRCFECHDGRKGTAGYRLDVRATALRGGESGEAGIVPHKAGGSELIRRVTSDDELTVMPPDGDRLSADQVAVLRSWIDAGAAWPDELAGDDPRTSDHWAFKPPVRPALPAVQDAAWCRNPIDRFVLAKLEAEGLRPSPEADRVALLRRLHLDLIGLPPTPEEIDGFLVDDSPRAYEKLVEQLLASPHYGEKWGRLWLDAARYADSDGYEKDKPRFVWFYRDWVVDALNRDLPYDDFIVRQFAGDLLLEADLDSAARQDRLVATGFLRNSMLNEEGGADPEQFRMEAMFDRMDAVGKAVLGLTVQCAQCHDHKFDPLTQEEYYGLFAFLNNENEGSVTVYTREERGRRAAILDRIAAIDDQIKLRTPDWGERLAAWEAQSKAGRPDWRVVRPEIDSSGGEKHFLLADGSVLAQSYAPTKGSPSFHAASEATRITAVRLELLNDGNLPRGGPGRSVFGGAALTEFKLSAAPNDGSQPWKDVKIAAATASLNRPTAPLAAMFDDKSGKERVTGPVALALDGSNETAWEIDAGPGRGNVPQQAVFVLAEPLEFEGGAKLTFTLTQNHGGWNSDDNQTNNLGRFRFSVTDAADATADTLPAAVREIVETVPPESRSSEQNAAVFSAWRSAQPEFADADEEIERLWQTHPRGTSQLVLDVRGESRTTSLLKRGDFLSPVRPVEPHVPSFLHSLPPDAPRDRLTLARWLVSRDSPTTARAQVNRVWQAYFGTGLVETAEDLGTQSPPPSHPQLLDWLAVEFMDAGWSPKHLHRLIVTSAAYRQSSRVTPDLLDRDPLNRLLARGPRLRVSGETVRDIALAAGGLLNVQVGGPPVYPPLPEFLLKPPVSYGPKAWPESQGTDRYRRALYTFRFRSLPYPMLQTFDAPPGDTSCIRRTVSNTPLQALVLLNEPTFLDCARGLARQTLTQGGTGDAARIEYAFRRCVARTPTPVERTELLRLLEAQRGRFSASDADPATLAGVVAEAASSPIEAAAWVAVSRVLLALDETITKE